MGKKGIVILVVLVLVGGFAAWFFLEGRFMVEGGRAPWAVINEEPEVLKEALKAGVDAEELSSAADPSWCQASSFGGPPRGARRVVWGAR